MKNLYLIMLAASLLVASVAVAQEPPARAAGTVLLLRNERTLEGEIAKVGTQYRVRRGRAESWIAGEQVVRLFADWEETYRYLRAQHNLGDSDERLRLARWCLLNRLPKQALAEASAALEMRPGHEMSKHLVATLERNLAGPAVVFTPAAHPAQPMGRTRADVDVSPETMIAFTTRVQPILMNACVSCHGGGRGGDFQLRQESDGGRTASLHNLAAVLAQVDLERPVYSPLLVKAASAHGGSAERPLRDRQGVPYQTLQSWLEKAATDNPHLLTTARETPARLPAAVAATASPLARTIEEKTAPRAVVPAAAVEATPALAPADPFDPAVFNQQLRPQK